MLRFACPTCDHRYRAPAHLAGMSFACRKCGGAMSLPLAHAPLPVPEPKPIAAPLPTTCESKPWYESPAQAVPGSHYIANYDSSGLEGRWYEVHGKATFRHPTIRSSQGDKPAEENAHQRINRLFGPSAMAEKPDQEQHSKADQPQSDTLPTLIFVTLLVTLALMILADKGSVYLLMLMITLMYWVAAYGFANSERSRNMKLRVAALAVICAVVGMFKAWIDSSF